jgi:hypothetical protein
MYIYNFKKMYKDKPLALDYGEWTKNVDIMERKYLTPKTIIGICRNKNTSQPISTFAKIGPTIAQSILPTITTIWVTCFLALFNAFHV